MKFYFHTHFVQNRLYKRRLMFNKRNIWVVVDTATIFLGSTAHTLFNFLLWEQGKSLELLLKYNLLLFISLAVFAFIGSLISKFSNVKITYILSLLASAATVYFALLDIDNFQNRIYTFSILWGANWGLVYIARSLITELIVPVKHMVSFNSVKNILSTGIALAIPLTVNYSITNIGYQNALIVLFVGYFLMTVLLIFIDIEQAKQRYIVFSMMLDVFRVEGVRSVAIINLSLGLVYSFGWGVMDIVILEQLGSLDNWTYVSFATAIIGIIMVRGLSKIDLDKEDKTRSVISFAALVFATGSLFLSLNFTLTIFVVFVFLKLFFDKTISVIGGAYVTHEVQDDLDYAQKKLSYQTSSQLITSVGRIVPIAVLLVLPPNMLDTTTIIIFLAILNFIPFFFIKAYQIRYGVFGTR